MPGGTGFVHYPQTPPRTAAQMGAAAEAEAMQRQAMATPGYLPYRGVGATLAGSASPAVTEAEPDAPMPPATGIGAALLARKQRHRDHLVSLGMTEDDPMSQMGGPNG